MVVCVDDGCVREWRRATGEKQNEVKRVGRKERSKSDCA